MSSTCLGVRQKVILVPPLFCLRMEEGLGVVSCRTGRAASPGPSVPGFSPHERQSVYRWRLSTPERFGIEETAWRWCGSAGFPAFPAHDGRASPEGGERGRMGTLETYLTTLSQRNQQAGFLAMTDCRWGNVTIWARFHSWVRGVTPLRRTGDVSRRVN